MRPQELEPRIQRVPLIEVFSIAYVVVTVRLESRHDFTEHRFGGDEVHPNVVVFPEVALPAQCAV